MVPRVLVIEPYPDLRLAIALTLQREHYACDAVADVEEAAHELGRHDYARASSPTAIRPAMP